MATKIVIDAGHNGLSDPGAVYNGRRESDDTLRLAMAVKFSPAADMMWTIPEPEISISR